MPSNSLKVETCPSHCTTPSERYEPQPVPVKVGCFKVNPASKRGRRVFLVQMLVVCFVPHVALLMQNCSIMAQLSQTMDSALYLDNEVNTVLTLGELIVNLQEERHFIIEYLLSNITEDRKVLQKSVWASDNGLRDAPEQLLKDYHIITLYHFREDLLNIKDLDKMKSYKRTRIYEDINSILLRYVAKNVKATKSTLWRQLATCSEVLKSLEELSLTFLSASYCLTVEDFGIHDEAAVQRHQDRATEVLSVIQQYFEVEQLTNQVEELKRILAFLEDSKIVMFNTSPNNMESAERLKLLERWKINVEDMNRVQINLWNVVRESAGNVVWQARRTLAVGVGILVLVLLASPIMVLLLRNIAYTIQTFTKSIEVSTQKLIAEKQKSDLLLSRMLPLPVLRNLRAQKTVPAEAFDAVTIFFSDIVGFTNISATSTPMEVINMLNMLYRLFDEKITHYDVYKVETIGDAYMVVSGLPQRNENFHASEIADMSLSLLRSLDGAKVPHRPEEPLMVRVGINTGPCVAGVVGTTMPRYCLFGDTINTASRMESTGGAMKIHISCTTKKALEVFGQYKMQSRGMVDVAGKGTMETFWLLGKAGSLKDESPRGPKLQDYGQNLMELLIHS